MVEEQIVFVSCGQFSEEEKRLGTAICKAVEELTPFKPYFAEYQTSLDGLTKNILGALDRCVGLIAILHPRGTVTFPNGKIHVRASIWVEQEIAIAAYLAQVAGRKLNIAAYSHESVAREGMRDQLLLNPIVFSSSDAVLSHLAQVLPQWTASQATERNLVEIKISYRTQRITQERHDYQLQVTLLNRGSEPIEKYYLEILFPRDFLDADTVHSVEIRERRTDTHRLFRMTQDHQKRTLFPGDPVLIYTMDYFVDKNLFWRRSGQFPDIVGATLYIPGRPSVETEVRMRELQNF
jgi:hypothetical protein